MVKFSIDISIKPTGAAQTTSKVGGTLTALEKKADRTNKILERIGRRIKATGLKQLQGLIWKAGFESGELQAHVYDDVPRALTAWNEAGIDVRIYSSGSIAAQKLFFGHTIVGNLLHCFRGHYDTTIGPKKEAASYEQIAAAFRLPAPEILFISDVVAELDAAKSVGLQTAMSIRPGNAAVAPSHGHVEIESFAEVTICKC